MRAADVWHSDSSKRHKIGKKRWNLPFASLDWLRQTSRGAKSATGSAREGYSRCQAHVCGKKKNEDPECLRRAHCGSRMLVVEDGGDEVAVQSLFLFPFPFLLPFLSFFLFFFLYVRLTQTNRANEWSSAWGP